MAAGRPRGAADNGKSNLFKLRLEQLKCDPVQLLAMTCNGTLTCGICHGAGKTKYQPGGGSRPSVRTCQSCWGSGKERLSPRERREAASDLLDRCYPRLKAVELTGEDGGPLQHNLVVEFVKWTPPAE